MTSNHLIDERTGKWTWGNPPHLSGNLYRIQYFANGAIRHQEIPTTPCNCPDGHYWNCPEAPL